MERLEISSCSRMRGLSRAHARNAGTSELQLVQPVEQGLGVLLVTGLARIVGAERETAHTGELLSRNLGELLAVHLLPEILVQPAAVHLGLGQDWRGQRAGERGEGNNCDCEAFHVMSPYLSAATEHPKLPRCRYEAASTKFQAGRKQLQGLHVWTSPASMFAAFPRLLFDTMAQPAVARVGISQRRRPVPEQATAPAREGARAVLVRLLPSQ